MYLDTSYIVKCYLREPGTEEILAWLEGRTGLSCCLHGRLEFVAAVKRHVREKRLSLRDGQAVCRRLEVDERAGLWRWFSVTDAMVQSACQRLEALAPAVFLRAADALHLTCALEHGFDTVYSHDEHLLAAAPAFGLKGVDILGP
ncbi:MAG: hypothetical protein A3K19_07790 [Lentisphaerae bacterium RIFOXYB12_FULL_65_16]|nr:MAG: hypothetical protein A3K18_07355 [Lentisphaerae bacterium RIFOXYA12_64_32]OGV87548.1 MAG: hypothetical protein A3K19_07790 [Lentisphaerae bacterium RIFOXYB12_FULL_65_16]